MMTKITAADSLEVGHVRLINDMGAITRVYSVDVSIDHYTVKWNELSYIF